MPLVGEFLIVENLLDNAATDPRTHRVLPADKVAEVDDDALLQFVRRVIQDIVERTETLAVKSEVLGEALRNARLHVRLVVEYIADCPRVLGNRAGRKALIRGVEEWEQALSLAQVDDGYPLLLGGVDARGVVRAGMQQNHIARLSFAFESVDHAVKVQRAGCCIVVRVRLDGHTGDVPDGQMVGPGWVRKPDLLRLQVGIEKDSAKMIRAGTGDGLDRGDSAFGLAGVVSLVKAEHQVLGDVEEWAVAFDGGVFVAEQVVFSQELCVGFLDDGERPWLAFVGAVDANSQVDLVRVGVFDECVVQGKDLIRSYRFQSSQDREWFGSRFLHVRHDRRLVLVLPQRTIVNPRSNPRSKLNLTI